MKTLVFGKNGQVASELQKVFSGSKDVLFLSSQDANFENVDQVVQVIREHKPKQIINASAYTAVDKAESEVEKAFQINAKTVGVIAEEAKRLNAALVHYSTDYVFDGSKNGAYVETDSLGPVNVYGQSKAEGENLIQQSGVDHIILRISWVYGTFGNNFLKTMLRLGKEKEELKIVSDQIGCPTWSYDIAETTKQVLEDKDVRSKSGLYHYTNLGKISWFDFATEIFNQYRGFKPGSLANLKRVLPIKTSEYKTAAVRPLNSRMNCEKIEKAFGIKQKPWDQSLKKVIEASLD